LKLKVLSQSFVEKRLLKLLLLRNISSEETFINEVLRIPYTRTEFFRILQQVSLAQSEKAYFSQMETFYTSMNEAKTKNPPDHSPIWTHVFQNRIEYLLNGSLCDVSHTRLKQSVGLSNQDYDQRSIDRSIQTTTSPIHTGFMARIKINECLNSRTESERRQRLESIIVRTLELIENRDQSQELVDKIPHLQLMLCSFAKSYLNIINSKRNKGVIQNTETQSKAIFGLLEQYTKASKQNPAFPDLLKWTLQLPENEDMNTSICSSTLVSLTHLEINDPQAILLCIDLSQKADPVGALHMLCGLLNALNDEHPLFESVLNKVFDALPKKIDGTLNSRKIATMFTQLFSREKSINYKAIEDLIPPNKRLTVREELLSRQKTMYLVFQVCHYKLQHFPKDLALELLHEIQPQSQNRITETTRSDSKTTTKKRKKKKRNKKKTALPKASPLTLPPQHKPLQKSVMEEDITTSTEQPKIIPSNEPQEKEPLNTPHISESKLSEQKSANQSSSLKEEGHQVEEVNDTEECSEMEATHDISTLEQHLTQARTWDTYCKIFKPDRRDIKVKEIKNLILSLHGNLWDGAGSHENGEIPIFNETNLSFSLRNGRQKMSVTLADFSFSPDSHITLCQSDRQPLKPYQRTQIRNALLKLNYPEPRQTR